MSTKIFSAWHTEQPMSIFQLVQFAHEVKEIQNETKPADIADSVCRALGPWLSGALEFFGQSEEEENACAAMVGAVLYPIMRRHAWGACWTFPSEERAKLEIDLKDRLRGKYVTNRKERMQELMELCESIYEFTPQSDVNLCFLSAPDGSDIYIKGFELTEQAAKFIDSKFKRFNYTDACEMGAESFPELAEKAAAAEDKNAVYAEAQAQRGALWDAAMGTHNIWKDASLSFKLNDVLDRSHKMVELQRTTRLIFRRAKNINQEKKEEG